MGGVEGALEFLTVLVYLLLTPLGFLLLGIFALLVLGVVLIAQRRDG